MLGVMSAPIKIRHASLLIKKYKYIKYIKLKKLFKKKKKKKKRGGCRFGSHPLRGGGWLVGGLRATPCQWGGHVATPYGAGGWLPNIFFFFYKIYIYIYILNFIYFFLLKMTHVIILLVLSGTLTESVKCLDEI